MPTISSNASRSTLNRLVVACRDEVVVLDGSAPAVSGAEPRARLLGQARRRLTFRRDIAAGIIALGGVPATNASYTVRLSNAWRNVRRLVTGPHEGDAYAACARATARTAQAYSKALAFDLPSDVRFGLERQYTEIRFDRDELRRLRWGAKPSPAPGANANAGAEHGADTAPKLSGIDADVRPPATSSDDGGPGYPIVRRRELSEDLVLNRRAGPNGAG